LKIVELDTVVMCLTPGDVEEERKLMVQRLRDPRAARVLTRSQIPDTRGKGVKRGFCIPLRLVAFEKG